MTTDQETYNGWANRETWALALHINNDQRWQEQTLEALRDEIGQCASDDEGDRATYAGEIIRNQYEELLSNVTDEPQVYASRDLMLALQDIGSARRIDWDEIGASFLEDLDES